MQYRSKKYVFSLYQFPFSCFSLLIHSVENVLRMYALLQEDVPDEFATLVLNFISRNRIGPHGIEVGI